MPLLRQAKLVRRVTMKSKHAERSTSMSAPLVRQRRNLDHASSFCSVKSVAERPLRPPPSPSCSASVRSASCITRLGIISLRMRFQSFS